MDPTRRLVAADLPLSVGGISGSQGI